jgi:hypothetical protein
MKHKWKTACKLAEGKVVFDGFILGFFACLSDFQLNIKLHAL